MLNLRSTVYGAGLMVLGTVCVSFINFHREDTKRNTAEREAELLVWREEQIGEKNKADRIEVMEKEFSQRLGYENALKQAGLHPLVQSGLVITEDQQQ